MSLLGRLLLQLRTRGDAPSQPPARPSRAVPPSFDSLLAQAEACRAAGRPGDALDTCAEAMRHADPAIAELFGRGGLHGFARGAPLSRVAMAYWPRLQAAMRWAGALNATLHPRETRAQARDFLLAVQADTRALDIQTEKLALMALFLGFARPAPADWTRELFDTLIEPLMQRAADEHAWETLLTLENICYTEFVQQIETGEHFSGIYARLAPLLQRAGRQFATQLPPRTLQPAVQPASPPVIGFVLNNAGMLAHVELMLNYLEAVIAAPAPRILPEVYVLNGPARGSTLERRLESHHIPLIALDEAQKLGAACPLAERVRALRSLGQRRHTQAVVWISAVPLMAFAFSTRIAPAQIWWAMKYHGLSLEGIDGYLTTGSLDRFKHIEGRLWRTSPMGVSGWHAPELSAPAAALRAGYEKRCSVVLGCIGREEKLNSRPFLLTVCAILKRNPGALFLWTGRQQIADIQSVFDEQGVAAQCEFIGWVDTRLYAQVLDIFADSFPFPCGFTAMQAMAAGTPLVFFDSPEAYETGPHGVIAPILRGKAGSPAQQGAVRKLFLRDGDDSLFLSAGEETAYAAHVQRLIDDIGFRRACGGAGRAFVDQFLSDPSTMADCHTTHILEIIQEAAARPPGQP